MHIMQSRRDFLAGLSAAGAERFSAPGASLADEGPPETTTLRLPFDPNICLAPAVYRRGAAACGRVHRYPLRVRCRRLHRAADGGTRRDRFRLDLAASVVFTWMPASRSRALAGVHSGCYELFAHEPIRTISDLKGKRVGIRRLGSSGHLYVAIMAAHVGLDPLRTSSGSSVPRTAMPWSCSPRKVDAFLGFPPEPQELRARKLVA